METTDLLKKAKKIFIRVSRDKNKQFFSFNDEEYSSIIEQYKDEITFIGEENRDNNTEHYLDKANSHHYKTRYMYENWLKSFNNVLGIDIDEDDFFMVKNVIDDQDFSYLQAKKEKEFECIYCDYSNGKTVYVLTKSKKSNYGGLCNCCSIINDDCLQKLGFDFKTPYHRLFCLSHQVGIIKNKGKNNGKVLFISCDSHVLPILPILCYYYKEVRIFDNRSVLNCDFSFLLNDVDDLLIVFSESHRPCKFLNLNVKNNAFTR